MDEQNQQQPQNVPPQQPQVVAPQWQYQSGQLEQTVGYQEPAQPIAAPAAVQPIEQDDVVAQDYSEDATDPESIQWSASEFVSHEKNGGWYMALAGISLLLAAVIYLLTRELFSIIVIGVLGAALAVFGSVKPRILSYAVGPDGIQVGDKHFVFETFRSFAIFDDTAVPSIQLLPQKRFMVPITVYFAPNDEQRIVEFLGDYLPIEHRERDFVDKITSRFHF